MLAEFVLTWFALTFLLIIWLGFAQTPADGEERPEYGTAAVVVFVGQAAMTLFLLAWTGLFAIGAAWLAFCLLCHHAVIHRNTRFDGQPCSCSWFQCSDVGNHETWVVATVTAGLISALRI